MKIDVENEPKILIDGIYYYRHHYCHCKRQCGKRIPYPKTIQAKRTQKCYGVPKFIQGHNNNLKGKPSPLRGKSRSKESIEKYKKTVTGRHQSKEVIEKRRKYQLSDANPWRGRHHTKETKDKQRKAKIGKIYSEERNKKLSKALKKYYKKHPKEKLEFINNGHKSQRPNGSEPELTVYEYVKELFYENTVSKEVPIQIGNKIYKLDIVIPHIQTVIEVDGCHWHKCFECYPLQTNMDKALEKREYDRIKKDDLEKQKIKVIRIWTHDVDNGKYKTIIDELKIQHH